MEQTIVAHIHACWKTIPDSPSSKLFSKQSYFLIKTWQLFYKYTEVSQSLRVVVDKNMADLSPYGEYEPISSCFRL